VVPMLSAEQNIGIMFHQHFLSFCSVITRNVKKGVWFV